MQYIVAIINALTAAKPYQYLMWGGWILILVSALSGIAGVAVVDEMRKSLILVGVVMVACGTVLAIVRAYFDAKNPPCLDDDDDPDPR